MEEESKKATQKAMALLLHKDRTRQELFDRLLKAGFAEENVEDAIAYVESFHYIDDERYARVYISYHRDSRSAKEIRYKLKAKGVPAEIIDHAIEDEYHGPEDAIRHLLEKRLKGRDVSELTREERQKHIAYLGRKGYPFPEIRRVFDEL